MLDHPLHCLMRSSFNLHSLTGSLISISSCKHLTESSLIFGKTCRNRLLPETGVIVLEPKLAVALQLFVELKSQHSLIDSIKLKAIGDA